LKALIILLLCFSLQAETFEEYKKDVINDIKSFDFMTREYGLTELSETHYILIENINKSKYIETVDMHTLTWLFYKIKISNIISKNLVTVLKREEKE